MILVTKTCMYVCMYACMYVLCTCMYVLRVYVFMYECMHLFMYVFMYIYICIYVCLYGIARAGINRVRMRILLVWPGYISRHKPAFHPQRPLERLYHAVLETRRSVTHPDLRYPQSFTRPQQMLRSRRCRARFHGFQLYEIARIIHLDKVILNSSPPSYPFLPRGPLSPTYK